MGRSFWIMQGRTAMASLHKCRFQNTSNQSIIIKLVGARNQFNAQLAPAEIVTAQGATAIVEGNRVVIAWDESTDAILDQRKILINQDTQFELQANGLFAIGAL
jgi:hypothetical protein